MRNAILQGVTRFVALHVQPCFQPFDTPAAARPGSAMLSGQRPTDGPAMPLQKSPTRNRKLLRLVPWLVGVLPVICGLAIMHWQAQRELQARAHSAAQQAVQHLDQVLDNVAGAARNLLPLAGKPCEDVKLALREQVTRGPYVRSTNLAYRNELY